VSNRLRCPRQVQRGEEPVWGPVAPRRLAGARRQACRRRRRWAGWSGIRLDR